MAESSSSAPSTAGTPIHPDFPKWANYIGQRVYIRELSGQWIIGTLEEIKEDNVLIVKIRTATECVDGIQIEFPVKQWIHEAQVEKLFCWIEPDYTKVEEIVD